MLLLQLNTPVLPGFRLNVEYNLRSRRSPVQFSPYTRLYECIENTVYIYRTYMLLYYWILLEGTLVASIDYEIISATLR